MGNVREVSFASPEYQVEDYGHLVDRLGSITLGIIASVSLRRRFVDFDSYIATHGLAQYRKVEEELSQDLLRKYRTGSVIVGLGGVASRQQQVLLQHFARDHPVVYVRRAEADLRQFVTASQDKFDRFYRVGNVFFESCSNFELFNITHGDARLPERQLPSSLKLKETERLFCARSLLSSDAFSPSHTLALQVPVLWLDSTEKFEELDAGADVISLVMDLDTIAIDDLQGRMARYIATIRMHTRLPIVVDVGFSTHTDPDFYTKVLDLLPRLASDAITCSMDRDIEVIRRLNATKGHTKRNQFPEVYTLPIKAQELGFESIRMTGESISSEDSLSWIALRQSLIPKSNISIIMYNTGILGRTSVCLNPVLSPVVLPESGCIGVTVPEVQKALTACFLSPRKLFTIVGQLVEHSLSPVMHNAAFATCGLPHVYRTLAAGTLSHIQPLLDDENHGGIAVSLPYKTAILPFLDEISRDARDINAVNTVVLERRYQSDGSEVTPRRGYNTDYIGVRNCIRKHLSPANAIRDGTTALVIGAGGMARAAIYACYKLGIRRICIYNRTSENATRLADYYREWAATKHDTNFQLQVLKCVSDPWPADFSLPTIVVSCLPGQEIGSEVLIELQISDPWLRSKTGGVFLEVAYGPVKQPLLEQMLQRTSRGWVIVDGLTLLVEQGIAQYELFTGRPALVHVMRRVIHEDAVKDGFFHLQIITFQSKMTYQPAIMSASLGRAWVHDLPHKITQAARAGFKGIEIFYEDLNYAARKLSNSSTPSPDRLLQAADHIHSLCTSNGLAIIGLQPFLFDEGLKDRDQHAALIAKMRLWLRLVKRLRTDTIQIPANFLPADQLTGDLDVIVQDLQEMADMGAAENPGVRFAYENLCWSTHVDSVERLWEVVRRVDRPNFGVYPASITGKTPNADADLKKTIEWMVREIDVAKVFYIQVVDAEKMASPLVDGHPFHVDGQPARMSWSRMARTFIYEEERGAYLPVAEVARAIISGLGYRGFVSMELFSRTMAEEGENVPVDHAKRGITAWKKLQERLQLE
ncbi:hypothetical protein BDW59DRAFT_178016 [Aspergillus cavernicola]|uniref:Quinate repressor protein n=1 Tax=Aspergillus cavernicola TaxID=176166 RepID=A0ABR4ITX4_9EURO